MRRVQAEFTVYDLKHLAWEQTEQRMRMSHELTYPVAIMATVPKPYSSPPSAAATITSRPDRMPPSTRSTTRSRSSFFTSVCGQQMNVRLLRIQRVGMSGSCSGAPQRLRPAAG